MPTKRTATKARKKKKIKKNVPLYVAQPRLYWRIKKREARSKKKISEQSSLSSRCTNLKPFEVPLSVGENPLSAARSDKLNTINSSSTLLPSLLSPSNSSVTGTVLAATVPNIKNDGDGAADGVSKELREFIHGNGKSCRGSNVLKVMLVGGNKTVQARQCVPGNKQPCIQNNGVDLIEVDNCGVQQSGGYNAALNKYFAESQMDHFPAFNGCHTAKYQEPLLNECEEGIVNEGGNRKSYNSMLGDTMAQSSSYTLDDVEESVQHSNNVGVGSNEGGKMVESGRLVDIDVRDSNVKCIETPNCMEEGGIALDDGGGIECAEGGGSKSCDEGLCKGGRTILVDTLSKIDMLNTSIHIGGMKRKKLLCHVVKDMKRKRRRKSQRNVPNQWSTRKILNRRRRLEFIRQREEYEAGMNMMTPKYSPRVIYARQACTVKERVIAHQLTHFRAFVNKRGIYGRVCTVKFDTGSSYKVRTNSRMMNITELPLRNWKKPWTLDQIFQCVHPEKDHRRSEFVDNSMKLTANAQFTRKVSMEDRGIEQDKCKISQSCEECKVPKSSKRLLPRKAKASSNCSPEKCPSHDLNVAMYIECNSNNCHLRSCNNRYFVDSKATNGLEKVKRDIAVVGGRLQNRLIATGKFEKNEFVGEYTGELVKRKDIHSDYTMELDSEYYIDAQNVGNETRFVNHSCDPNTQIVKRSVNGYPRIGIVAESVILPGEELTYKYCKNWSDLWFNCQCGALNCVNSEQSKCAKFQEKLCELEREKAKDLKRQRFDTMAKDERKKVWDKTKMMGAIMKKPWSDHNAKRKMRFAERRVFKGREENIVNMPGVPMYSDEWSPNMELR